MTEWSHLTISINSDTKKRLEKIKNINTWNDFLEYLMDLAAKQPTKDKGFKNGFKHSKSKRG